VKRVILSLTLVIALLAASNAEAAGARKIVLSTDATGAELEGLCLINGCGVVQHMPDGIVITLPARASEKALAALLEHNKVILIEDDAVASAVGKPTDKPGKGPGGGGGGDDDTQPVQEMPWGVNRVDADFAWGTITGAGVNIAIVDTGIDYTHPDLAANYMGGYNAINTKKSPKDDDRAHSHGTHCAGIVAALNNEIGVVGVAPGAGLYAVKVLDRSGSGWVSDIIEGIDWCIWKGDISVISMSLGADVADEIVSFRQAVQRAAAAGIVVVCAAGNHDPALADPGVSQPGRYPEAIAVAATGDYQTGTPSDGLASFSNTGPEVDIAAPGVAIYSTMRGGSYGNLNGTSMACPHVTGVVALMKQAGTWSLVNLYGTADNIGLLPEEGGAGLLDAEEAAVGTEGGDN